MQQVLLLGLPTTLLEVEDKFASLWLLFQQNPFTLYFSSMKARRCLESATVLQCCLLSICLSSMEIGAHTNLENQLANLVLTLF